MLKKNEPPVPGSYGLGTGDFFFWWGVIEPPNDKLFSNFTKLIEKMNILLYNVTCIAVSGVQTPVFC